MSELVANKKQRLSDDDDGEELGSDESLGSEDGSENGSVYPESEEEPLRANDLIDLVFIEPDAEDYAVATPEFTHQVFDDEDHLEEVRFLEKPEDIRIPINIRCQDMMHFVGVPCCESEEERRELLETLKKGLPDDTQFCNLKSNDPEAEDDNSEYHIKMEAFATTRTCLLFYI